MPVEQVWSLALVFFSALVVVTIDDLRNRSALNDADKKIRGLQTELLTAKNANDQNNESFSLMREKHAKEIDQTKNSYQEKINALQNEIASLRTHIERTPISPEIYDPYKDL